MDIGSIFLLLALTTLVGFFLAQPFLNRRFSASRPVSDRQTLLTLQAERDRAIQALQELDFDYSLGKVPEEDYPSQRNELVMQGAEALRKLDALQPASVQSQDNLEEALAARRKAKVQRASESIPVIQDERITKPEPDENLEALILARRRIRNGSAPREKSVGFCPQCGKPIQKSDRFCPKCGTELR